MLIRYHLNWLVLALLYYLSNHSAVQLPKLEASGLSCFDLHVFINRFHDDLKTFMIKVFLMQLQPLKAHSHATSAIKGALSDLR